MGEKADPIYVDWAFEIKRDHATIPLNSTVAGI